MLRRGLSVVRAPSALAFASCRMVSSESKFIRNVFSGRLVLQSSPFVKSLRPLGIGMQGANLAVVDALALQKFADAFVAGKKSLPHAIIGRKVTALESCLRSDNPVASVAALIEELIQSQKKVKVVGEVVAGTAPSDASADTSEVLDTAESEEARVTMNKEQLRVKDLALAGYNMYLGGNAGTGKTVVIRELYHEFRSRGLSVAVTATTGIAGCHIKGATFHSIFGLNYTEDRNRPKNLDKYDVIIIDEISMLQQSILEKLDSLLQRHHNNALPFGGVQIIVCGDFLQLGGVPDKPVYNSELFDKFVCIKLVEQVRQAGNARFAEQLRDIREGVVPTDLAETVKMVPSGTEPDGEPIHMFPTNTEATRVNNEVLENLPGDLVTFPVLENHTELRGHWSPSAVLRATHGFKPDALVAYTYRQLHPSFAWLTLRDIVCYKTDHSDGYVLRVRCPSELVLDDSSNILTMLRESFVKAIAGLVDRKASLHAELVEMMESGSGLHNADVDATLGKMIEKHPVCKPASVKVGARVLLRANLNATTVNGSIGTVLGFENPTPENLPRFLREQEGTVRMMAEYERFMRRCGVDSPQLPVVQFNSGTTMMVPPGKFDVGGDPATHYYGASCCCLPLTLAYAFTVHKVQGLTLRGRVHLELENMWKCPHLMYVALSRVKSPEQLTVAGFKPDMVVANPDALAFDKRVVPVLAYVPPLTMPVASWKKAQAEPTPMKLASFLTVTCPKKEKQEKEVKGAVRALRERLGSGDGKVVSKLRSSTSDECDGFMQ